MPCYVYQCEKSEQVFDVKGTIKKKEQRLHPLYPECHKKKTRQLLTSLFETVIQGLGAADLAKNARVIVEKPFGRDLESAQELNRVAHSVFPEDAIFRIDHYFAKEAIMNIHYFPINSSHFYIDNKQQICYHKFIVSNKIQQISTKGIFCDQSRASPIAVGHSAEATWLARS